VGKLVTVVGNSGVGKTTFARRLTQAANFVTGFEQHQERPYQQAFSEDYTRYGLHNQVDYLVFRAEQEVLIRKGEATGIQDGGLEMDFFVFTRLFYLRGYLSGAEYLLCERLYALIRQVLPPPDLILRLVAPLEIIAHRFAQRNRSLEIARQEDLEQIERLIEEWIGSVQDVPVLSFDATREDPEYGEQIARLVPQIQWLLEA
jgi:deoxyadenosine/deoxycytidine kinase